MRLGTGTGRGGSLLSAGPLQQVSVDFVLCWRLDKRMQGFLLQQTTLEKRGCVQGVALFANIVFRFFCIGMRHVTCFICIQLFKLLLRQ